MVVKAMVEVRRRRCHRPQHMTSRRRRKKEKEKKTKQLQRRNTTAQQALAYKSKNSLEECWCTSSIKTLFQY
jgi:hypothetical protein